MTIMEGSMELGRQVVGRQAVGRQLALSYILIRKQQSKRGEGEEGHMSFNKATSPNIL